MSEMTQQPAHYATQRKQCTPGGGVTPLYLHHDKQEGSHVGVPPPTTTQHRTLLRASVQFSSFGSLRLECHH